jgi:hypothetical protein
MIVLVALAITHHPLASTTHLAIFASQATEIPRKLTGAVRCDTTDGEEKALDV